MEDVASRIVDKAIALGCQDAVADVVENRSYQIRFARNEGGKYVEAAVGGALDQGAKECAGSFWKYEDEHFLATSNGAEGHDHRASLYLSIRALVSLESSGHGIACGSKLSEFQPEKAGQK